MGKVYLGIPAPFPQAAREALADRQLRANLHHATSTIRAKRAAAVAERDDWEALRTAARAAKDQALADLGATLLEFERNAAASGAVVHWARTATEANDIVAQIAATHGVEQIVKVKSLATDEIGLNEALAARGVQAIETDLAELIVQLADEHPSHILVPAIHKNRDQIRDLFVERLPGAPSDLTSEPRALAGAARARLRTLFLSARMAVSGANAAIAETGSLVVVESEGNGRMCLTLPEVLVSIVGIEKVLPRWQDLETFLQVLPRSSTGERMNPYTSVWTGASPGDGPREVHVVLLDNGRSAVLADPVGRDALACIRCSACLNVCPVYERTGGHAYGSVYPGPIGAILSPQLWGEERSGSLPYASTLCGACYDVCPVKIDIPSVLVYLRNAQHHSRVERTGFRLAASVLKDGPGMRRAGHLSRLGRLGAKLADRIPLPVARRWTASRAAPVPARQSFRAWWRSDG
jgi:L-lactate dehydrogenase complex protein LldF